MAKASRIPGTTSWEQSLFNNDNFPHENKGSQAQDFYDNLFNGGEYEAKVNSEVQAYFARNGYDVTKLQKQ